MNSPITPQDFLEQVLQIQRMEHGSLSVIRQGPNGPYYNLNSWEEGANQCRYIPQDKLPEVQQAIEGYQKFHQLTQAYAQGVVEQTRAELGIGVKKKPRSHKNRRPKGGKTPALARLVCLEEADQDSYQQAEEHLNAIAPARLRPPGRVSRRQSLRHA